MPAPYLPALIERIVPRAVSASVSTALREMAASGANRGGLVAALLESLASARAQQPSIDELIELVTTGPEAGTVVNRHTQVVVQELFRSARRSILVAGYEYRSETVLRTLADRMKKDPAPCVRMFLNVKRGHGDTSRDGELIAAFGQRFRAQHWPAAQALPEVYFDPRPRALDAGERAVLHAKCVVVDERTALVSSANFY